MNPSIFAIFLLLLVFFLRVQAQTTYTQELGNPPDAVSNFRPSLAVVIGILCIMISLTFLLLIYAKFCHTGSSSVRQNGPELVRSASRFSGIDKTVVESLPFFKFSSLRGSKEGLECSVCLSKFEDIEILRLLPKCKHAFHINCVDRWLEKHSSCPLCRRKVNPEDPTLFTYSNSMRYLGNPSDLRAESNIELFVEREENRQGSSRFSIGSSFRKLAKGNKEEESLIQEQAEASDDNDQRSFNKFKHKIIVSDVVLKNRWSSASSSDLMFLNSEMLHDLSSNRFSPLDLNNEKLIANRAVEDDQVIKIKEEMEMKRLFESKISTLSKNSTPGQPSTSESKGFLFSRPVIDSTDRRSVSEITTFSRFRNFNYANNTIRDSLSSGGSNNITQAERQRLQLWLPIARRTAQWFANRERRIQQAGNTRQSLDV